MKGKNITVSVFENPDREFLRFNIDIPRDFIENENFVEAMGGYELGHPALWLRALADQIDAITEGEKNG